MIHRFPFLLAALAGSTAWASAATSVQFTITLVTVPGGASTLQTGQQFTGTLGYSAMIPSVGTTTLSPASDSSITLTFDFGGNTYTQRDDLDFPDFPEIFFENGLVKGISFEAANKGIGSSVNGFVAIEASNHLVYSFDGVREFDATVTWGAPVSTPEPSAVLLLSASSLVPVFRRRRSP